MTKFAYFCGHEQWHPEQLLQHARLARDAGFDMLVASEHFHPWVDDASASGYCWSTLGGLTQTAPGLHLSTGVTTPLWRFHPALVAQAAATVDRMSGGRFYLGVGTGENINEGPLGYEFAPYKERSERMSEALEIMRRLLDGEKLTFAGKYYKTDRAKLYSPPLGPVPILLAAGGPQSARLAGRKAQGVIVSVKDPAEILEKVIEPARQAAQDKGRPRPQVMASRWTILAENDDQAWKALYSWRGLRAPGRLEAVDPKDLREAADNLPRQEILGRYSQCRSARDIIEVYRPLVQEIEADVVTLQMAAVDQESLITLLGSEVLPALREMASTKKAG
jgi:G6PDH family F420-dependent oxidoreductase